MALVVMQWLALGAYIGLTLDLSKTASCHHPVCHHLAVAAASFGWTQASTDPFKNCCILHILGSKQGPRVAESAGIVLSISGLSSSLS